LAVATEADVKDWSRRVLEAYDRGDAALLEIALSPQFVHFEGGKPTSREQMLELVKRRRDSDVQIGARDWADEQVITGPQGAVFLGKATENSVGNESHGGDQFVGWYKLIWVPAGERYQLMFLGWQIGGDGARRAMWDSRYEHGTGFDKQPNRLLAEAIQKLKPGAALDLATGQGRNALYLAERGWRVTGIDFSSEGIKQARATATSRKLKLELLEQDIDDYEFGTAKWDLVTMLYATDNEDWIERSKLSLKPGGLFVFEFFEKDDREEEGIRSEDLAEMFSEGFDILRNDVVVARPDWAQDSARLIRFIAKKR
jgi:SAM-dependent methyltransferase